MTDKNDETGSRGSQHDSCFLHNLSTNLNSTGTTLSVSEYQNCQRNQSPFQDLKTAWSILLSKYVNTSTVLFGAISASGTLEEWKASINEEAHIPQAISLYKVRDWENRELGSDHDFNTFLLESIGLKAIERLAQVKKHVDLTIGIDYSKSRFRICIYSQESFLDQDQAELLNSALIHTLKSLQSTLPLKSIDLISDLHGRQLNRWNRATSTGPLGDTIHNCIERQCLRRPEAEAVCAWDGSFSYGELDMLSSEVRDVLHARDVLSGMIVPLLFEKSKWTVVAMLGVLKAGAAFVAIDPSFPQARVQAICHDVKAPVILCSIKQGCSTSCLDFKSITIPTTDPVTLTSATQQEDISASEAHHPAYIAYTSGSTGTPKGVVISHGNFCTNMALSSPLQNLSCSSRVLQFASYAFDVSIHETLTPLMLGGSVCIPSESQRVDNLQQAILDLRVNWIELVPSVARLLDFSAIPEVKTLVVGGETMRPSDISRWAGQLHLTQAYGPAECTIVSTIQSGLSQVSDPRNIGYSAAGSSWIVEPENHSKLVPIGAVGELVIGGPIVGGGYLDRPEQTAQSFISDIPWSKRPGTYYKTGDLARQNSDGSIVYMGRKDTQVKIRGQRVELGEIEHLAQEIWSNITPIAEVVTKGDRDPILVLFVGPIAPGSNIASDDEDLLMKPDTQIWERARNIQCTLREVLPRYMIPDVFVPIQRLPLMPSGKVDRKLLRNTVSRLSGRNLQSFRSMMHPSESPVESSDILHACIAQVFSSVLGLPQDQIGVSANFFHLGGDSALAIALVNEARIRHSINITVASIFENPTIATLAQSIKTSPMEPVSCQQIIPFSLMDGEGEYVRGLAASKCGVIPEDIEDIYPCTPLQERLMAWTASKPGAFRANFDLSLPPSIDWRKLNNALRTVIQAYPILRTRIVLISESLRLSRGLQVVVREDIAWNDATTCQNEENTMSPGTPLFYCYTVHGPGSRLKLTLHHALFDSWSYSHIIDAVETAYNGTQIVTSPFVPFIKHLLDLDDIAAKSFWTGEFDDLAAVPFPAKVAPGHIPRNVARCVHSFCLQRCNENEITLSTACRLAWALVVACHTGSLDVVYGVTVTGRNSSETASIVGPTITTFPLRVLLHSDEKIYDALKNLQKHVLNIMPYEHFGVHRMRQCSSEAVSASQFQSLLVVQPARPPLPKKRSHSLLKLMEVDALEQQTDTNFATQVLTIICEYAEDTMRLRGVFDPEVIPPEKVKGYLHQMSDLLNLILISSSDTVGDLLRKTTEYVGPEVNEKRQVLNEVERAAQTLLGQETPLKTEWVIPIDTNTPKLVLFVGCKDDGSCVNHSCVFKFPDIDTRARLHKAMTQLQTTLSDAMAPVICLPVPVSHESVGLPSKADLKKEASKLPLKILQSYMCPQEANVITAKSTTDIQSRLRRIMGVILHIDIDDVGLHDSFFTLGGDSILAMQVVAQCRDENIYITAHDIFDAKTIHRIALRASPSSENNSAAIQDISMLPDRYQDIAAFEANMKQLDKLPRSAKVEDVYPCTDPHMGLLRKMSSSCHLSYTIWEVTVNDVLIDIERLLFAWNSVSKRHAALRTILMEYCGSEHHVVLGNCPTEAKVLRQLSSNGLSTALRESHLDIQQSQVTPYRLTIYQSDAGQVLCKFEGSHAFLDASSVLILLRELSMAYRGLPFPAPAPSYRSWVTYLDSWRRNSQHLDYWRQRLSGISQCLFPTKSTDCLCPDNCTTSQLQYVVNPLVDTNILQRFCSKYEVTITNVLQLSWALVLQEYCQSSDVCFGTTISGRDAPINGVQEMVGSIFNVLPCRFLLDAESSFLETLEWSQKSTLEDKSHQFCSLVDLEGFLLPGSQDQPLFNTCLSVESALSNDTGGLSFRPIETHEETHNDILVVVTAQPDKTEAQLMYWSHLMNEKQAMEVTEALRKWLMRILENPHLNISNRSTPHNTIS
ncbi:nonribosomal peptide synthase [Aspergillus tubingensis]|uniref:gramicidin S synthetase 1 n=1 Tax=Aspergillus tubingensis TaxID=5068 RepID=UPI001579A963|nr:gramicidin S synthetase 1 [Aspergillus tubingensis]GFN16130.1 gramicidin S synthetase 1 [Aspergillus tubingensis]GLA60607.1 nonribosomal peptide synthase [Aspergillus tubingensis]